MNENKIMKRSKPRDVVGGKRMAPPKHTSIIILAWNQLPYTRMCIESVQENTTCLYELVLVDNGSTDGTLEYFASVPNAKVIHNEENRGFAAGCNQGIMAAAGDYLLLLNNDTVVSSNWLTNLINCLESSPDIGIVGPRSNYVSGPQLLQVRYSSLEEIHKFAQEFNRPDPSKWFDVQRLVGFCLLIKREVVERIGLLDERFGIGNYEDDDFCLRALKAGYRLVCAGDTFVHHFGNKTFIGNGVDLLHLVEENRSKFNAKWSFDTNGQNEIEALKVKLIEGLTIRDKLACEDCLSRINEVGARRRAAATALLDGDISRTREFLDQVSCYQEAPDIYLNRGLVTMVQGEAKAEEYLIKSTEIDPHYFYGWIARGDFYLWQGDYDKAKASYQQALKLAPQSTVARLGCLLVEAEDKERIKVGQVAGIWQAKKDLAFSLKSKLTVTYLAVNTFVTGGVKIFLEQANRLVDRGHKVYVVSYYNPPEWFSLKAEFIQVPVGSRLYEHVPPSDVVIATFWTQIAELCAVSGKSVLAYLVQGDKYLFERQDNQVADQELVDGLHLLPINMLVVSRYLQQAMQELYQRASYYVPNAIDHNIFYPRPRTARPRLRLLVVGPDCIPAKGIQDIAVALNRLSQAGVDFQVTWITPERPQIVQPLWDVIINPSQEELAQVMADCDIYISGSHYEAFSLPPLEAMASGVAVVTTANQGVAEYARHEFNCLMVPPQDPMSMSEAVLRLIRDDRLRHELVANGLKTAEKYHWDHTIDCLEEVLWTMVSKPQPWLATDWGRFGEVGAVTLVESSLSNNYYHFPRPEVVNLVPEKARRVLDIGCAAGVVGGILKQRGTEEVIGVEINNEVAREAAGRLDRVLIGDIEEMELPYPDKYFDCIVVGDVLEHLRDPWALLRRLGTYLSDEGRIVASIPNVAHIAIIKGLVGGEWQYTDAGILDRTHLRFFTLNRIREMFTSAGFKIIYLDRLNSEINEEERRLAILLQSSGMAHPAFLEEAPVVQYLVVAQKAAAVKTPRLSLCMIVKNEEEYLPRCLSSVQGVVDEIIVVDTGSTDRTVAIAESYGAKVCHFPWTGDFSEARNISLEKASGDWIIFLDADEELLQGDGPKLRSLLTREDADGYYLTEVNFVGDRPGLDAVVNTAFRVFRNKPQHRFTGAIHEQIVACVQSYGGQVAFSDVRINHYGYLNKPSLEKDKIKRNLTILEKEVAQKPDDNFIRFNLGIEFMRLGHYQKALEQFQKAFKNIASLELAYASVLLRNIALCLKELKRYKEALKVLNDAVLAYPDYTDLLFLKACVFAEMKNYSAAITTFQECLNRGESHVRHISQQGVGSYKAYYGLGQAYEQLGDYGRAVQAYTNALKENKYFIPSIYNLGAILIPREDCQEVQAFFARHLDLRDEDTLFALSNIFSQQKKYKEAMDYIDGALEQYPQARKFIFMKGEVLLNLRRFTEAVNYFDRIHDDSSYFFQALLDSAFCSVMLSDYEGTKEKLAMVEQEQEWEIPAQVLRHFIHLLTYEKETSVFLNIINDDKRGIAEKFIFNLLGKLLELEEFEKFERGLELLSILPAEERHLKLGKLYFANGFKESAAEELIAATQSGAMDAEALMILGEICSDKELYEDAVVFYQHAMVYEPHNLSCYTALASILSKLKQYDEAATILRRGIKHFPESELLRAALRGVSAVTNKVM